jgi:cyclic pyranopterin phosphate synthase
MSEKQDSLTHFNSQGNAKMVDVTDKEITKRQATAQATIIMQAETLTRIKEGSIKKGDVLAVAQTAGIMAAKRTSELIPMCHLLPLSGVDINFEYVNDTTIYLTATVKTTNQTGVEMEALTAVQISALTVYDMCKAMDRSMQITDCHLVEKKGGKSGHFIYGND